MPPPLEALGNLVHLGPHRLPVFDGSTHVGQYPLDAGRDLLQGGAGLVGYLEMHERFGDHTVRIRLGGTKRGAIAIPLHGNDRVDDEVHGKLAAVQFGR